jgi:hypothetical protein
MDSALLSLEDAAKLLGYTPSGLRKIVRRTREGKAGPAIRFFQVGKGPIRFRSEWLDDFVDGNSVMPERARVRAKIEPTHLKRPG